MPAELHRLIRASGLVWRRWGSARVYVAAIVGIVVILAAIGIWHLISSQPPSPISSRHSSVARILPGTERSLPPAAPSPAASAQFEKQVEITKLEQTEKKGPHGETFVVATIGLASRTNVEKNGVEIHVYFYDLTAENELRPTDAQVTYQWLTPVRDWSDPAPKFLAATYFKRPIRERPLEKLHYGGFVVRVFSDGKLQDEQSHPEALLALFRNNASEQSASASPAKTSSPTPVLAASKKTIPIASPSAVASETSQESSLPYGKPIPGKPGFLYSPYDPKFIIDVRGFPPGTLVNDPNTNKPFRVP